MKRKYQFAGTAGSLAETLIKKYGGKE